MHYGRTLVELMVALVAVFAAFAFSPVNFVEVFGDAGAMMLTIAIAASVSAVLYVRHRARAKQRMAHKLQTLRQLPVA